MHGARGVKANFLAALTSLFCGFQQAKIRNSSANKGAAKSVGQGKAKTKGFSDENKKWLKPVAKPKVMQTPVISATSRLTGGSHFHVIAGSSDVDLFGKGVIG